MLSAGTPCASSQPPKLLLTIGLRLVSISALQKVDTLPKEPGLSQDRLRRHAAVRFLDVLPISSNESMGVSSTASE